LVNRRRLRRDTYQRSSKNTERPYSSPAWPTYGRGGRRCPARGRGRKLRRCPGGWGPVRLAQRQRRQPVAMGGQRRHAPRTPPSIRTRGRHHLAATQGTPAPQLRAVQPEGGTPASDRQHARGSSGSVGQALHDLGVTDPAMLTRAAMIDQAAAAGIQAAMIVATLLAACGGQDASPSPSSPPSPPTPNPQSPPQGSASPPPAHPPEWWW